MLLQPFLMVNFCEFKSEYLKHLQNTLTAITILVKYYVLVD